VWFVKIGLALYEVVCSATYVITAANDKHLANLKIFTILNFIRYFNCTSWELCLLD